MGEAPQQWRRERDREPQLPIKTESCTLSELPSRYRSHFILYSLTFFLLQVQGQALDTQAKKTVKVLVVGNPANTNALICSHYAPSIPKVSGYVKTQ